MKGFIEIKEDVFDDTIEHLHRIKAVACQVMKKLEEYSNTYDRHKYKDDEDDDEEYEMRGRRRNRGRYGY